MLLELAASTLAIHVLPNIAMKTVKSTKAGHKLLTSTLALGIEHGKSNKKLQFNFQSIIEYGIGPEALAEYHLGVKLGKEMSDVPAGLEAEFMIAFKASIESHIETLDSEEKEIVENTPVISAITSYIEGDYSEKMANSEKFTVDADAKVTASNVTGNIVMLAAVGMANYHLLAQPVISYIRKKLALSKFGRNLMRSNYEKGLEGKTLTKAQSLAIDLLVSPAVLDTMKIGNAVAKVESLKGLSEAL